METIHLEVSLEEAVAIVNWLGTVPTAQGAHPLWVKLKAQVEPRLSQQAIHGYQEADKAA